MKAALILFLTFLSCLKSASINENRSVDEELTTAIMENLVKEEELLLSDGKRDILSIIFGENVLQHTKTDFLIRLFDSEMRGKTILSGRKREIERVLRAKMRKIDDLDEILNFLSYAHTNGYEHALLLIIDSISDTNYDKLMNYIKYLDFSFYEHLKACKAKLLKGCDSDSDAEYDMVEDSFWREEDRPDISIEVFKNLTKEYRLPAYIRYITNMPVSNDQITSKFIKENVLNRLGLGEIFVMYELEMMDTLHTHDTKAVIETHLKSVILFESNENMANMAGQLFDEGYDKALKLIIDQKFSYKSPVAVPLWFQDLFWLLNYAEANDFSDGFNEKVISVAKPSAVRRYVSKAGSVIPENKSSLKQIESLNGDGNDDEDIQIIDFRSIK